VLQKLWKVVGRIGFLIRAEKGISSAIRSQLRILKEWEEKPSRLKNPLTKNPRSYFSQSDEDGILAKILDRLGKGSTGTVIEFGVETGIENNSLALLARGWCGFWVGAEEISFKIPESGRLAFSKSWITLENIEALANQALEFLGTNRIDVMSMDLDGNDFHFTQKLLENDILPDVWISEYNAKYPVGSYWVMPYDENHSWQGDDYYGASFTAFTELFRSHGYFPVACSVQGANVFFVKEQFHEQFLDVNTAESEIFEPLAVHLVRRWGRTPSTKTIENFLRNGIVV
jgi:hypothetical protein